MLSAVVSPEGREVGRYRLLEVLGQGAFGTVYRAEDELHQSVALKVLSHSRPSALSRFKHEFRAVRDVRHPNLVRMRELFLHDRQWIIAQELVEGSDFLAWVRGRNPDDTEGLREDGCLDETRLRASLKGMTEGLRALHAAGLVHRDLKPTNVKVTGSGRAVLLDFGLVTALDSGGRSTNTTVGTASYMAPEQAANQPVTAAVDWYALGVCLYEALTGRLPFEGPTPLAVMLAKQDRLPLDPARHAALDQPVPEDLARLCMQLLQPNPHLRAGASDVLAALRDAPAQSLASTNTRPPPFSDEAFSGVYDLASLAHQDLALGGRDAELSFLRAAYERSRQGDLQLVLMEGDSGIGKTTVIAEFARRLVSDHAGVLVLRARCYENEQVPYKAFDGCMDLLAHALGRMPENEVQAVVPLQAALLAQLFPVLADVPVLRHVPKRGLPADPGARRLAAFQALAELMRNLSLRRPLVMIIDDIHWADAESFRLLQTLVQYEPAPRALLLFTTRPQRELDPAVAAHISQVRSYACARSLPVVGLDQAGAESLTARLLGQGATPRLLQAIASESQGHPLFIHALAQFAASRESLSPRALTLDAALGHRVARLPAAARRLLDLLAVAGRPHDGLVFAHAMGGPLDEPLAYLTERKLARLRSDQELVCFHDRVRQVILDGLPADELRQLHHDLSEALASIPNSDPADRALHLEYAGQHDAARQAYERGADSALEALAFARAERLYEQALALTAADDERTRHRLTVQRAHAFGRGGNSREAARLYREASLSASGETRIQLLIWSAQQLLHSGQVDEGLAATRTLFGELDMPLPRHPAAARRRLLWERAWLSVAKLERGELPLRTEPKTKLQLEASWNLSTTLAWVQTPLSRTLNAMALRRALRNANRVDLSRALAGEALSRVLRDPWDPAGEQLLVLSRRLARRADDPSLDAFTAWTRGTSAALRGSLWQARESLEWAERTVHDHCADRPWLRTSIRASLARVWNLSGAHHELAKHAADWLAQAADSGDLFAQGALAGYGCGFVRHLMVDDTEAVAQELQATIEPWPKEPLSLMVWGDLFAAAECELYQGGAGAWQLLERARSALDAAPYMSSQPARQSLAALRGQAALAARGGASRAERTRMDRTLMRSIRVLQTMQSPVAQGAAALLLAQHAALLGKRQVALIAARSARETLELPGSVYYHAAAHLEAWLADPQADTARHTACLDFFRHQGWVKPARALAIYAPALPLLMNNPADTSQLAGKAGHQHADEA